MPTAFKLLAKGKKQTGKPVVDSITHLAARDVPGPQVQAFLKSAKSKGHELCCDCSDPNPPMTIVRKRTNTRAESFHFQRPKDSFRQHSPNCPFSHDPNNEHIPGMLVDESGTRVRLEGSFEDLLLGKVTPPTRIPGQRAAAQPIPGATGAPQAKTFSKGHLTLLSFFRALFEGARLIYWRPEQSKARDAVKVQTLLAQQAENVTLDRSNRPLSEFLIHYSRSGATDISNAADAYLKGRGGDHAHAMVFGQLEHAVTAPKLTINGPISVTKIKLVGLTGVLEIWGSKWDDLKNSHISLDTLEEEEDAKGLWERPMENRTVWLIALIEVKRKNGRLFIDVVNLAPQLMSKSFVPVESGLEAKCAERLIADLRSFRKPLRYVPGEQDKFPDFVIEDLDAEFWFEVWGMNTPDYNRSREAKEAWARENQVPFGWWQAFDDPEMKNFPTLPAPCAEPPAVVLE